MGLTLIDKKQGKAVRVAPLAEAMERNKQTGFMALRKKGVPPTQIPDEISEPLVWGVMSAPLEKILKVGAVTDYEWHDTPHSFDTAVCEGCGEMVVKRNMRIKDGKAFCIPCTQEIG